MSINSPSLLPYHRNSHPPLHLSPQLLTHPLSLSSPPAYINGEFYVDSLNIIATLERAFPDTPALLFPKDHPGSGRLKELIEMAKLNVFYKTVTGEWGSARVVGWGGD